MAADNPVPSPSTSVSLTPSASPPSTSVAPAPGANVPKAPGKKKSKAPALSPEALARLLGRFDVVLVVLVVLFTFVTAAFPVYNSDFYEHLAVGRLLVRGQYTFGEDPFTFTSRGVYWANHAWLFDLIVYGLYSLPFGGVVVVAVKAGLLAFLTVVLLATARRAGASPWLAACFALLAVLAASPRFYLQPACLSMVLLAVLVWLLRRPLVTPGADLRSWWWLPALCALWVNLDQWFLLGPVCVGLFLLGSFLQRRFGPEKVGDEVPAEPALRLLGYVFLACLGACLLSPHHYHALALPQLLGFNQAGEALRNEPQFRAVFASPLDFEGYYYSPYIGLSVAGLAWWPLLVLCLLSFWANWLGFRWWRALLPAALFGLSALHARALPFFAVVAGPVAALNFAEFAGRRLGALAGWNENQRRWALTGRGLSVLVALVLVVAAVPGWLQGQPRESRRFGFGVVTDESLRHAAEQLAVWRKDRSIYESAYFNLSPEVVHYVAWFGDDIRGFMDQRLDLFGSSAQDYHEVRTALGNLPQPGEGPATAWRSVFENRKVRLLVFYSSNLSTATSDYRTLIRLLSDREEWGDPIFQEGGTVVFAWRNPKDPLQHTYAGLTVDLQRQAFGPKAIQAPGTRTDRERDPSPWYASLWHAEPRRTNAADDAQFHFVQYQAQVSSTRNLIARVQLTSEAASLVPALAMTDPNNVLLYLWMSRFVDPRRLFFTENIRVPDGPPTASLYLALRSARLALAQNPEDASSHFLLGQIYYILLTEHPEGADFPDFVLLQRIRRSAAAYHLRQAVDLKPDTTQAHRLLCNLYERVGMYDLQLKHFREFCRCTAQDGRSPLEKEEDFARRLEGLGKVLAEMEKAVAEKQRFYNINAPGSLPAQQRALKAYHEVTPGRPGEISIGLAETARLAYAEVKVGELNPAETQEVVQQWIDLLFDMGELRELRENWSDAFKGKLGMHKRLEIPAYEWFEARLAAASGDYDLAIADFSAMAKARTTSTRADGLALDDPARMLVTGAAQILAVDLLQDTAQFVGPHLPTDARNLVCPPHFFLRDYVLKRESRTDYIPGQATQASERAQVYLQTTTQLQILPGWLAMEQGRNEDAARLLRQALEQRNLTQRGGIGPYVAPPLSLLAGGDALQLAADFLTVRTVTSTEANQRRIIRVEALGANALNRIEFAMKPRR